MTDYEIGAIKRDPDTRAVAVRTSHAEDQLSWGVMTVDIGGHYASAAEVADWEDVPT